MKRATGIAVACIAGAALFVGCEKAPQADIDKAKQAVAAAEAEASTYAADKVAEAKAALDSALATVKAEDAKLLKNYTAAKVRLESAISAAKEATTAAAKKKEALKNEADEMVGKAQAAVEEAQKAVADAKKKATDAAKTLLADAEKALASAVEAVNSNDFADAKSNASAAIEKAGRVKSKLLQPKAAAKKKK